VQTSDDFLWQQFLSGDRDAFTILVNRYKQDIFRFILSKVKNREQALDLTQDVFIKLFQAAGHYVSHGKFKAYLYRIAQNSCIDNHRKKQKASIVSLSEQVNAEAENAAGFLDQLENEANNPAQHLEYFELQALLKTALDAVPENQKTALLLCQFHGMSYSEIAEIQNCPVGTVKSRIHHALLKMREFLKDFDLLGIK